MTSILDYDSIVKIVFPCSIILLYYILSGRKKLKYRFNSLFSEDNEYLQIANNLFILIEIAILFVIILAFWDIFLVHQRIKNFGQWGDFFGGILNPILTFLTFIGLMITIILQQIELKESKKEFARTADALSKQEKHMQLQTFENTFFKMLELHNNILENLKYSSTEEDITAKGREIFKVLFDKFYKGHNREPIDTYLHNIHINQNHVFGQYFRNLYQILKFIRNQEIQLNRDLQDYANILRAQLSSYELIFLFLNCFELISDEGEFKDLLIKFSFLQHFPIGGTNNFKMKYADYHDYEIFYDTYDERKIWWLTFFNNSALMIGEKAFKQFYKDDKSAFTGNELMENIKFS